MMFYLILFFLSELASFETKVDNKVITISTRGVLTVKLHQKDLLKVYLSFYTGQGPEKRPTWDIEFAHGASLYQWNLHTQYDAIISSGYPRGVQQGAYEFDGVITEKITKQPFNYNETMKIENKSIKFSYKFSYPKGINLRRLCIVLELPFEFFGERYSVFDDQRFYLPLPPPGEFVYEKEVSEVIFAKDSENQVKLSFENPTRIQLINGKFRLRKELFLLWIYPKNNRLKFLLCF